MEIRLLSNADRPALEAFLLAHRDSSMILRSNALRFGLEYRDAAFHAHYAAADNGAAIVAVAAHSHNGMIIVQAPEHCAEVTRAALAISGRKITGLLGPRDQVTEARSALGLVDAAVQWHEDEALFALELAELSTRSVVGAGTLQYRPLAPEDRETISAWRVAYGIETLGGADSEEHRSAARGWFDWQLSEGSARVATENGVLVSLSAFNATLPDMVQLGGIYTPPEFRARHYARSVIAATLVAARERGVQRAVLFASNPDAIRCYEALGFQSIGAFGLVLLA